MRHQRDRQRRTDQGAAAIAHDRKAGRHAAVIGKPFDERRNRRDVAEPLADAADEAAAEKHQPELMDQHAVAAQREAAAPAQGCDEAGTPRPGAFDPAAEKRSGDAEHRNERFEDVCDVGHGPVSSSSSAIRCMNDCAWQAADASGNSLLIGSQNTLKP